MEATSSSNVTPLLAIDFSAVKGPMKPEHGVGQPPKIGMSGAMYHYLAEAGVPYSRLHDVGGWHGNNMFVDIPNIFRDFDADENDPANYDFSFTDILMKDLVDNGVVPDVKYISIRSSPQGVSSVRL